MRVHLRYIYARPEWHIDNIASKQRSRKCVEKRRISRKKKKKKKVTPNDPHRRHIPGSQVFPLLAFLLHAGTSQLDYGLKKTSIILITAELGLHSGGSENFFSVYHQKQTCVLWSGYPTFYCGLHSPYESMAVNGHISVSLASVDDAETIPAGSVTEGWSPRERSPDWIGERPMPYFTHSRIQSK